MASNSIVPRDNKGKFLKGVSGNPSGKPKSMVTLADGRVIGAPELFRSATEDCFNVLMGIMLNEKSKDRDKAFAANILLNRGWGTPKQNVNVTTDDDGDDSVEIQIPESIPIEHLRSLLQAIKQPLEADIIEPKAEDGE